VKTVGELRELLAGLLDTDPIVVRVDASSPFFPDPEAELGFAAHVVEDEPRSNELVVTVRLLDGDLLADEEDSP
jgi:hypothetical protein